MVGEHSIIAEVALARGGRDYGRENVGISNRKISENLIHRKSKGSWATRLDPGLGEPKFVSEKKQAMEKQVNIPVSYLVCLKLTHF